MITCFFENNNKAKKGLRHITVNAIVMNGNKVLLGKRGTVGGKAMLESGKWGLVGGFFDRDENLIQAVKREVLEESGCEIDEVTLFRINDNPNRPKEDRQNVDIIFIAKLVKQIPKKDEEVNHLEWFSLDILPPADEMAFDHGDDIDLYLKHCKNPRTLPLLG